MVRLWLHKHPNIWSFIKKIKAEESSSNLKYIRINNSTYKRRNRCSKDVQRDLIIQKAKFNLMSNKINVQEYLEKVSQIVHDKIKNNKLTTTATTATASTTTASASIN